MFRQVGAGEGVIGAFLKSARLLARRLQLRSSLVSASVWCGPGGRWMKDECVILGQAETGERGKRVTCEEFLLAIVRFVESQQPVWASRLGLRAEDQLQVVVCSSWR